MSCATPQSPQQSSYINYGVPGEQTAQERSGLDLAGLVKSASPGLGKELLWKAKRHIYLKQSPAREMGNFILQAYCP